MKTRLLSLLPLLALASGAFAQTWSRAYESGLTSARQGKWSAARESFKKAATLRPEDASAPTLLPGPPTERRRWRDGAPYSPNFLAAYSLYRVALNESGTEQTNDLKSAGDEFEALLKKGQTSRATYYFANQIYAKLGDVAKSQALQDQYAKIQEKADWRVDTDVVAPEDNAAIEAASGQPSAAGNKGRRNSNDMITIRANDLQPGSGVPNMAALVPGRVPFVSTKYALIIGNSESKVSGGSLSYASEDAQRVRDAIVTNAGYPEANIELVRNGTAEQIRSAAQALVSRMPQDATVMIYFTGYGANVGGKDYVAGVDAQLSSDTSAMVAKTELFQLFMNKGAHIFSFFQTARPLNDGHYFGSETPQVGSIAQVQATLPGDPINSVIEGGRTMGVFSKAFVEVLEDLKSNRIPILEFGWQVFYKIRRGNTGTTGGGSRQTPTLPVLTNVASDARF